MVATLVAGLRYGYGLLWAVALGVQQLMSALKPLMTS